MDGNKNSIGPISYGVWKAALNNSPAEWAAEYPLVTDADLLESDDQTFGPYELLNTRLIPSIERHNPALILRITHHDAGDQYSFYMDATDDKRHHGGDIQDEIAALVSICVGIKIKAGAYIRVFRPDTDPRGKPTAHNGDFPPPLSIAPDFSMIPRTVGQHTLKEALPLQNFLILAPDDALALVKAARQYQEALWVSEFEPGLSWLMLVSAIEIVANQWRKVASGNAMSRLKVVRPDIISLLESGDPQSARLVADMIIDSIGSTSKFIDFILEFLPDPPTPRPDYLDSQCDWSHTSMAEHCKKIYRYRSRALHDGIPFPEPMCQRPGRIDLEAVRKFKGLPTRGDQPLMEKPCGLASGSVYGNVWLVKEMPMLLCTFEYIVRHTILNWWSHTAATAVCNTN